MTTPTLAPEVLEELRRLDEQLERAKRSGAAYEACRDAHEELMFAVDEYVTDLLRAAEKLAAIEAAERGAMTDEFFRDRVCAILEEP